MPWTPPPGGVEDEQRKTPASRRRVGVEPSDRAGEELAEVRDAAGDVAADVVRVVLLELGGCRRPAGEDPVAEARREALDLASIASVMSTVEPFGTWQ